MSNIADDIGAAVAKLNGLLERAAREKRQPTVGTTHNPNGFASMHVQLRYPYERISDQGVVTKELY